MDFTSQRIFGRRRRGRDAFVVALLLVGFSGLAAAIRILSGNWFGALLPIAFIYGSAIALRREIREIETRGGTLVVRTLFRDYAIPRAHITNVVLTAEGAAIDVLNGNRYDITPAGEDRVAVWRAVREWWDETS